MDIEQVREYCLAKNQTSECFPFDQDTLVFKVYDKMFLLISLESNRVVYKGEPETLIEQREHYSSVEAAFHMNKTYWNMMDLNGQVPSAELRSWIDQSYELVLKKIPKSKQKNA